MLIKRIEGATRTLGQAQGYLGLPVRDECVVYDGERVPQMVTAWEPTPDELVRLNAGAAIELTVLGSMHPPVYIGVGKVPE